MEKTNTIFGNGQLVFVEPSWVTGETCLTNVGDQFQYIKAKSKLYQVRKDFLARLEKEGYVITYDKSKIDEDTVCLTMNDLAVCDASIDIHVYKKKFDERMFEAGGEKLNYPYSVTVEEYFSNPFFPAVFKNELANGGVDKFFIENNAQLEVIKKFYYDFAGDEEISQIFQCSIFQQFIETPTKNKTYMRLLMSASGDVMGASLRYSKASIQKRDPKGIFESYFWDEKSEYFLNCNGMFNYYSDGGTISFSQPKYSDEKREILKAHDIDPDCPEIPSDVVEVAANIAKNCNPELGIICGIDFILNERDNKWYYLEIQAFPAIEEWAAPRDIRVGKIKSIDDYVKYLTLELDARYEAFMMYMNQKYERQNQKEPRVLKLK